MMDTAWLSVGCALLERSTGKVLESNPSFGRFVGTTNGVLEVLELTETLPDYSSSEIATTAKQISVEKGTWLQVHCKAVEQDKVFLEVSDITKQVDADKKGFAFLELSFDGFWDWHMTKDYEYMSPRFWEMFGYEPHEKPHKPSAWQEIVLQEDVPAVMETLNKHVATRGSHPFRSECRYHHKDGSTVVVYCNGRVIEWSSEGAPVRMIGTHTDITELRHKQKLATEHQIHEYLAHKIRNPLTAAVGAMRFLQEQVDIAKFESDDDNKQTHVEMHLVHDNLMKISSILARLAALHHIHTGEVTYTMTEALIMPDILRPAVDLAHRELLTSLPNIAIDFQCESEDLKANCDVLRVKQVVFGLFEGCVARLEDLERGRISIVAKAADEALWNLTVQDSGPTVIDHELVLLGSSSDGVQTSTTGLHPSIYVARALVQGMGGTFVIDNKSDNGLKVVVTMPGLIAAFPSTEQEDKKEECKSEAELAPVSIDDYYTNARCLVIDDEMVVRKMLTRRLGKIIPNATVDAAKCGEEGITLVKEHDYSLVVVDHYLEGPGRPLNGAETICQLRLLGLKAPIVGCSANDVSALHLEAGANSFLQKPTPRKNEDIISVLNSVVPREQITTPVPNLFPRRSL